MIFIKKVKKQKALRITVGIIAVVFAVTPASHVDADDISGYDKQDYEDREGIPIDDEYFPDDEFREYVADHFDEDLDDALSDKEISKIKKIDVGGWHLKSLKGIEYFATLKTLKCDWCNLTSLDISKNKVLEKLVCYGNELESLDVSNNKKLETLSVCNNRLKLLNLGKYNPYILKDIYFSGNGGHKGKRFTIIVSTESAVYYVENEIANVGMTEVKIVKKQ